MPEVSFYVLPGESSGERYQFACKLIEKAYRSGVYCYVLADTGAQAQQIDDLLWTFRAGSFIPHQIYAGEMPAVAKTILIGSAEPPEPWRNTIVNLSSQCPKDFQSTERILEILDNGEDTKRLGRERYKLYQQAGIEITTHKISG